MKNALTNARHARLALKDLRDSQAPRPIEQLADS